MSISLIIGGREIRDFSRYQVASDLFCAADAFSVELADPSIKVARGARVQLKVDGKLELTGLLDRRRKRVDKSGVTYSLEGRDLMGLLVDSYCLDYPDQGKKVDLKELTHKLTADLPALRGVNVHYSKGDKSRAVVVERREKDSDSDYKQIKPGKTRLEVLTEQAHAQGCLIYALPDGTICYGEPATGGKPVGRLVLRRAGRGNNIISAQGTDDITRRYSQVTVIGQCQGEDEYGDSTKWNSSATVSDKSFPFFKPYVARLDNCRNASAYARLLLNSQRFESEQLEIKAPGHSLLGATYQVNAVYQIDVEDLEIKAPMLCYSRTFELGKDGETTTLRFSPLGVLPE